MKATYIKELTPVLLLLLFVYTSTSKFLDYDKFVFQMDLAPVPFLRIFAHALGWIVPVIEVIVSIFLTIGFFHPIMKLIGLYASVILLLGFEIYIATMLISGSNLPCTCGGIISEMGWKQHLFFNAFFIIGGILSIKNLKKNKISVPLNPLPDKIKTLSRA